MRHIILITGLFFLLVTGQTQEMSLDYYLEKGRTNSPYLMELNNQLASNRIDSSLIRARQLLPSVSLTGNLYYAPVINSWGYSEVITNGGNFISTLNVSQPLFNRKSIRTGYARVGILDEVITNSSMLAGEELRKVITAQYLSAFAIQNDIVFYRKAYVYMQEEDSLLRRLTDQGYYSQTEYLSFQVEIQSLELDINTLQVEFRKAISALNILCGISEKAKVTLLAPDLQLRTVDSGKRSPLFYRYTLDSLIIDNERREIDLKYIPAVSWQADAGIVNNVPKDIYKNFGISLGLNFSLPVYDGKQRLLNYRKLNFREDSRRVYESYFRNRFDEQLWQLTEEIKSLQEMIPKLNKQLDLAGVVIRQKKLLLNNGSLSMTDYLISLRNYLAISNNLRQNEVKIQQIINEINYWKQ